MLEIPETHHDLLDAWYATLATVGASGRPQLSTVWFLASADGTVQLSGNATRQKAKNMVANPKIALHIQDPSDWARYLELRGDAMVEPDDDYVFAETTDTTTTAAPTVQVSGQADCIVESDGTWSGPALEESGLPGSSQRDYVLTCIDTASDPRVEGDWTATVDCDFTVNDDETVGECSRTSVGTNEWGTWEATFAGTTTWTGTSPAHMHVIDQTAIGSGDYDGLTYVSTIEGSDFPWTVTGEIGPSQ